MSDKDKDKDSTRVPSNSDGEVQRVLRRLVEREVISCVSMWVGAISELAQSGGESRYVDAEETYDWWMGAPDKKQAILDAGYDTVEYEGKWYWYESSGPTPFGGDLPDGYEAEYVKDVAEVLEESGDTITSPGWYWGVDAPEYDDDNCCQTWDDVVRVCWQDVDLESFDDEEDAVDDCIYMNSIDVEESRGEVYEHWEVTNYFARLLRDHGEVVFDICGTNVWGRMTSGQAIALDHVIWEIGKDMEILPGQENYRYWREH